MVHVPEIQEQAPAEADRPRTIPHRRRALKPRVLAAFRRNHRVFRPPWSFVQLAEMTGVRHHQFSLVLSGKKVWTKLTAILEAVAAGAGADEVLRLARTIRRKSPRG